MGTIKFVDGNECQLREVTNRSGASDGKVVKAFSHHAGGDDEPRLFEVEFPPDAGPAPHAHDVDEIIVVTAGEMVVGRQRYGVGSSVFIPKMTLYSFRAGSEGLRFLNFRPAASNVEFIGKDDFMAMRADTTT